MPKIEVNLSKAAAKTFETIFNTSDPKELAGALDFDIEDFKKFLKDEKIEEDEDLKEFIEALKQKEPVSIDATAAAAGRMTITGIINQLADETGITQKDVKVIFDNLFQLAVKDVAKNGEFLIPGFGKLIKARRESREGRNPATGSSIKIPAKTTVKFRFGKAMKEGVK